MRNIFRSDIISMIPFFRKKVNRFLSKAGNKKYQKYQISIYAFFTIFQEAYSTVPQKHCKTPKFRQNPHISKFSKK